jgi:hypothetical protein
MKRILLASLAALTLCSGCILDDEFWDDGYESGYDSPAGDDWDDCDCDDEYFSAAKPAALPDVAPAETAR